MRSGCACSLQIIDKGISSRRYLLAKMEVSLFPFEPNGIDIIAYGGAPDFFPGFSES
jgi:hypothetical protein